jgi:hypothetical protein
MSTVEITERQLKNMSEEEFHSLVQSGKLVKICVHDVKIKLTDFMPLTGYELKKSDIIGGV